MLFYAAYADFPADTFSTDYVYIDHNQTENVPSCSATITDFYPKEVAGGIGEILTIQGFQFGATKGQGAIFMENADDGGITDVYLDDLDIILWSDTLIKLKVPSYDSAMVSGTAQAGFPAGTGYFKVFADDGTFDTSPLPLKIKYSVSNHSSKNPHLITPRNQFNQAWVFHCDTAVTNYQNGAMKAVIDKALRDWTCLTGINWYLSTDTAFTNTNTLNDTLCVIKLATLSGAALASTARLTSTCGEYVHFETDIEIDSTYIWFCDTTGATVPTGQYDFYHTILHELGHAHDLLHVIDGAAIMHYATSIGVAGATNLSNDISCDEGGNWEMDYATDPANVTTCGVTSNILRLANPCSNLGIYESNNGDLNFTIYPNPFSTAFNIDFYAAEDNEVTISLTDIRGRHVKILNQYIYKGENSFGINVEELPAGIYILRIASFDNELNMSTKIIKDEN